MALFGAFQDMRTIKSLLTGAEQHAHAMNDELPGAEHLLLSAFDLPEGSARRAFLTVGADPARFTKAIEQQHLDALKHVGIDAESLASTKPITEGPITEGPIPFKSSASLQELFQRAGELARADKKVRFCGAHVVLAVTEMEHGTAARSLRKMNVDSNDLRIAAEQELKPH